MTSHLSHQQQLSGNKRKEAGVHSASFYLVKYELFKR